MAHGLLYYFLNDYCIGNAQLPHWHWDGFNMDYFTNSSTPPYNCTGKNSKIFKYVTKLCRLNNFDPISYTTLLNRKHQNVKQTLKILLLKVESVGPDQEFIQLPFQYLIISLLLSGVHHFLLASPCVDESADDPGYTCMEEREDKHTNTQDCTQPLPQGFPPHIF